MQQQHSPFAALLSICTVKNTTLAAHKYLQQPNNEAFSTSNSFKFNFFVAVFISYDIRSNVANANWALFFDNLLDKTFIRVDRSHSFIGLIILLVPYVIESLLQELISLLSFTSFSCICPLSQINPSRRTEYHVLYRQNHKQL